MATHKQEQLYNDIVKYYDYADKLIRAVEDSKHTLAVEQFEIIENAVETLEGFADKIATCYIEFVKKGKSKEIVDDTRDSLNEITAKVEECKNRVMKLHERNNEAT